MKKLLFVVALLISLSAGAKEIQSADLETDFVNLSGNLRTYPYVDQEPPAQTPPPEGYVPFHLEHYGRHGSRWLIGGND